jgi:hypothetical protein
MSGRAQLNSWVVRYPRSVASVSAEDAGAVRRLPDAKLSPATT